MPVLACEKGFIRRLSFFFSNKNFFIHIKQTISPEKLLLPLMQNKNRYRRASLTAEAAIALPLFFYTSFLLWQCFLLLLLQLFVCREAASVALTAGSMGYTERASAETTGALLYKPLLWKALEPQERIEALQISLQEDGEWICVQIRYDFLCEAVLLPDICIPVTQTFCFLPYLGEYKMDLCSGEFQEEDTVYVTETGKVYHESKSCVYLSVQVTAVAYSEIETKRNSAGKKYTACDRCVKNDEWKVVYISSGGRRFHEAVSCPSLKRLVLEKKRDEVTLPACSKCGKGVGE